MASFDFIIPNCFIETVNFEDKLPLKGKPIMCTFYKINGKFLLDATSREKSVADCRLSIGTLDGKTVCAMQKGGEGTVTSAEILDLVSKAFKKGEEIRKLIRWDLPSTRKPES